MRCYKVQFGASLVDSHISACAFFCKYHGPAEAFDRFDSTVEVAFFEYANQETSEIFTICPRWSSDDGARWRREGGPA
jgi:hypothetical protein